MPLNTIHCIIVGRVQGVCYRVTSCNKANELNLTGWVRNRADGSVELKASGTQERLLELIEWLPSGVPSAVVNDIACETVSHEQFDKFEVIDSEPPT